MDLATRKRLYAERESYNALAEVGAEIKRLASTLSGATWSGSFPNNPMTSQIDYKDIVLECTGMDRRLVIQIYKKGGDPSKQLFVAAPEVLRKTEYIADGEPVGDAFEIRWNPGNRTSLQWANHAFQQFTESVDS